MFLFQRRSSPLILITRSSSLLHVNVGIKNSVEKESTLLFCFLSKSPVGHGISRQKHLELSVVSYLLIGLFYIGMPVMRMDGGSVGRAYGHAITKISWMDGWVFERLFLINWENNRDCHITMLLSLKTLEVQIKGDRWNKRFRMVQVYWDALPNFLRCGAPLSRGWSTDIIRCVGVIRCPTSLTSISLWLKSKMRDCHLCLKVRHMTMFKSFLSKICIRRLVMVGVSRL